MLPVGGLLFGRSLPESVPPPPYLSTIGPELKKVIAEAKLAEPVEVSDPVRAIQTQ
jgi:hypothetical protein